MITEMKHEMSRKDKDKEQNRTGRDRLHRKRISNGSRAVDRDARMQGGRGRGDERMKQLRRWERRRMGDYEHAE